MKKLTTEYLQAEFFQATGMEWKNSQGEPDIDYVEWLEKQLISQSFQPIKTTDTLFRKVSVKERPIKSGTYDTNLGSLDYKRNHNSWHNEFNGQQERPEWYLIEEIPLPQSVKGGEVDIFALLAKREKYFVETSPQSQDTCITTEDAIDFACEYAQLMIASRPHQSGLNKEEIIECLDELMAEKIYASDYKSNTIVSAMKIVRDYLPSLPPHVKGKSETVLMPSDEVKQKVLEVLIIYMNHLPANDRQIKKLNEAYKTIENISDKFFCDSTPSLAEGEITLKEFKYECSECGRKTCSDTLNRGSLCNMPQPNGENCKGVFLPM